MSEVLRVVLLSGDFSLPPYGGIAAHVLGLGEALAAEGNRVVLVVPSYGTGEQTFRRGGLEIVFFRCCQRPRIARYFGRLVRARRFVREVARRIDADVLHVHDFLVGPPIARGLRGDVRRLVFTNHTSDFLDLARRPFGRTALRAMIGRPHGVISVSPPLHERSALLRPDRRALIPNGVDVRAFTPAAAHDPGRPPTVLCVGRLHPVKGLDVLLDAWPAVLRELPAARLTIAGAGAPRYEAWLRTAIARRGLTGGVDLLGRVPHDALATCYHAADLLCLPSRMEATSIAGLEAMACARPLVASEIGGLPLLVEPERTGLLVPPGDPEALAAALLRLLGDPALRAAMGSAARDKVLREYSWETIAERTAAFYRKLLVS